MNELRKPLPEFELHYEVSNRGYLVRKPRALGYGHRLLKERIVYGNSEGIANIAMDGVRYPITIPDIVYRLFVADFDPQVYCVKSKNGLPEWRAENLTLISKYQLYSKARKGKATYIKNLDGKRAQTEITILSPDNQTTQYASLLEAANDTGIDTGNLSRLVNGKLAQYNGFKVIRSHVIKRRK